MIKKFLLPIAFLLLQTILMAQTQTGIVKTRGRLTEDGTVIPGVGLSGASVTVKGSNTVVSGKSGTFKVNLPESDYYLKDIQKSGYKVVDPDFLSQRHSYSREPLLIVMETPSQQTDDRLAAERKIRRTLQRQLQEKEDEIERLKEENRISAEEYRTRLLSLYEEQESNEDIISEMAGRYSKIDYDQLDAFNEKVSTYILNGELVKADSLIRSKGNISDRANTILEQQSANAQEAETLNRRIKQLEKKKALTAMQRDDLARDCYSMFDICRLKHDFDSAAYYLEVRASLDTNNVTWLTDVAIFAMMYSIDYQKAEESFLRLIRIEESQETKVISDISILYGNLAQLYRTKGEYELMLEYFQKAIDCLSGYESQYPVTLAIAFNGLGAYYASKGPYEKGIEYLEKAISLITMCPEEERDYNELASVYNNLSSAYRYLADYDKALECLQTSIDIYEKHPSDEMNESSALAPYINTGALYSELKEYEKAIPYTRKGLALSEQRYGQKHPKTAQCLGELGYAVGMSGNFEEGVRLIRQSIDITIYFYGDLAEELMPEYNNIAGLYNEFGDLENAALYLEKILAIQKALEWDNVSLGVIYYNCAVLNDKLGNIEKASEFCQQAQDVLARFIPETHPLWKMVSERNELLKKKLSGKQ